MLGYPVPVDFATAQVCAFRAARSLHPPRNHASAWKLHKFARLIFAEKTGFCLHGRRLDFCTWTDREAFGPHPDAPKRSTHEETQRPFRSKRPCAQALSPVPAAAPRERFPAKEEPCLLVSGRIPDLTGPLATPGETAKNMPE